ncbi:MAG: hypothetical protein AAF693_12365, partial [Bacteroidota bacterium]
AETNANVPDHAIVDVPQWRIQASLFFLAFKVTMQIKRLCQKCSISLLLEVVKHVADGKFHGRFVPKI